MDYQEIVTSYKKKGLDITELKRKMELSKPLVGRAKYRAAVYIVPERYQLYTSLNNLLVTPETEEKLDSFEKELDYVLEEYFLILLDSIKEVKAWRFMGLTPSDYSVEKYKQMTVKEKFNTINLLNDRYQDFLEYQKVADIRDTINLGTDVDDDKVLRLKFLTKMFENLDNEKVKTEFFCFDKNFVLALISFRKSKSLRLEDFIKTKSKSIQNDYKKFSENDFFQNEDFRDIAECISLTQKTLRVSATTVIDAFTELSETECEEEYLSEEKEDFAKLEKKAKKMQKLRTEVEVEKKKQEKIELARKLIEEKKEQAAKLERKKKEEAEKKRLEEEKVERERIIKESEGNTGKQEEKIEKQKNTVMAREQINPLIFSWLEREDITLTRRVSSRKLNSFFDKIKQIQTETGTRISLFLVTNAGKDVALKRMQEFQKKARVQGLDRLVEGALGGYSSFKIDADGTITDLAIISEKNREKIVKLLEAPFRFNLPKEIIDPTEKSYIRYQFSDKKEKSIDMKYLRFFVGELLQDEKIKRQPLKFLPFIEGKYSGIDVLLNSQLQGISQLSEYYRSKYTIAPGKTINVRIDNVDEFIGEQEEVKE